MRYPRCTGAAKEHRIRSTEYKLTCASAFDPIGKYYTILSGMESNNAAQKLLGKTFLNSCLRRKLRSRVLNSCTIAAMKNQLSLCYCIDNSVPTGTRKHAYIRTTAPSLLEQPCPAHCQCFPSDGYHALNNQEAPYSGALLNTDLRSRMESSMPRDLVHTILPFTGRLDLSHELHSSRSLNGIHRQRRY